MLTYSRSTNAATDPPVSVTFRVASFLLGFVLAFYCIWLLFAELQRPKVFSLPTDRQSAANAAEYRVNARRAAWSGLIRGDLWAGVAFTFADLLWTGSSSNLELTQMVGQARGALHRALSYAPARAEAWLLLAGLASRYPWSDANPAEALRMSYYTGPNDLAVMPLRTLFASQLPALDAEMQQLARRDVRLLDMHQKKSAILQAYHSATPNGQRFIEQELSESDASFAKSLRQVAE